MDIFSADIMILFIPEIVHTIKIKAKWGGGGGGGTTTVVDT